MAAVVGSRLGGRPQAVADSAVRGSRRRARILVDSQLEHQNLRKVVFSKSLSVSKSFSNASAKAVGVRVSLARSPQSAVADTPSSPMVSGVLMPGNSLRLTHEENAVYRPGGGGAASLGQKTSAPLIEKLYGIPHNGFWNQRRMYTEARGQTAALAAMQDPVEVLNFAGSNEMASTYLLVSCLRRVSALCDKKHAVLETVAKDERLQRLIQLISPHVDDCDARCLVDLCWAVWGFRGAPDVVEPLLNRMASVVVRRENAFTPKQLGTIAFTFSWFRGAPTDTVADFVLAECVKLLPEMEPFHVTLLFGSLRRMRCLNRDVANLMIEKLTDDIDRFTSDDVVGVLRALASNSITRGFLLRRVATLVFDNLDSFKPKQLASVLNSLTLLRFLTVENGEELFSCLSGSLSELPAASIAEILEALTILNFPRPEVVRTCLDLLAEKNGLISQGSWVRDHMIIAAHAVIQFQLYDKNPVVKPLLEELFRSRVNSSRTQHRVEEVIHALDLEKASPRVDVPPYWRAMIDQANREEQARLEHSGLQNELTLVLDSLRGKFQLQIQKNQQAGPYSVQFLDDETKICIEIDYPCCRTPHIIKARHLKQLGYHYLLVDCWQWRRLRSEAEQTVFLKQLLSGPLLEVGRLEGVEPDN
ncbi:putative Pb-reticulocyte-binding protein [Toxoplasma gondii ARI]|uniref:Putative Pb-reticulocyte-binding protein n=1 Tax=Toxoplasma gondii ARI TaxID=1074872 RepID=A0A139XW88_TOXGO|nr:putative Pb-reticulocyte-binding protein [Toxoplasma gondii ARI]